jgi:hypothetical protein
LKRHNPLVTRSGNIHVQNWSQVICAWRWLIWWCSSRSWVLVLPSFDYPWIQLCKLFVKSFSGGKCFSSCFLCCTRNVMFSLHWKNVLSCFICFEECCDFLYREECCVFFLAVKNIMFYFLVVSNVMFSLQWGMLCFYWSERMSCFLCYEKCCIIFVGRNLCSEECC